MKLQPYKFQVVAICQVVDEEGKVTGERVVAAKDGAPLEVYGIGGLKEWADGFEARLTEIQES